jgi:hypothetical protein
MAQVSEGMGIRGCHGPGMRAWASENAMAQV